MFQLLLAVLWISLNCSHGYPISATSTAAQRPKPGPGPSLSEYSQGGTVNYPTDMVGFTSALEQDPVHKTRSIGGEIPVHYRTSSFYGIKNWQYGKNSDKPYNKSEDFHSSKITGIPGVAGDGFQAVAISPAMSAAKQSVHIADHDDAARTTTINHQKTVFPSYSSHVPVTLSSSGFQNDVNAKLEGESVNLSTLSISTDTTKYSTTESAFTEYEEQNYEEPEKNYEEPEQVYGEPEMNHEQPEVNQEEGHRIVDDDNNKGSFEDPEKVMDSSVGSEEADESIKSSTTVKVPAAGKGKEHKSSYVVDSGNFRKYRVEERTADGFIVGEYGVVSRRDGSLRGVRYTADSNINPTLIYKTLVKFFSLT